MKFNWFICSFLLSEVLVSGDLTEQLAAHDCVEYSGVLDLGVVTWHVVLYASSDDRDWPWPFWWSLRVNCSMDCDLPQTSQFPFHKWPPPLGICNFTTNANATRHNTNDTKCMLIKKTGLERSYRIGQEDSSWWNQLISRYLFILVRFW